MTEDKHRRDKPTYIMIPRKVIIAITSVFVVLFTLFGANLQYTNYVDRKSNQRFCGILLLSDKANRANPELTELGQQAIVELDKLLTDFHCR